MNPAAITKEAAQRSKAPHLTMWVAPKLTKLSQTNTAGKGYVFRTEGGVPPVTYGPS